VVDAGEDGMGIEVRIPSLGESVTEGVIVAWRKRDGEHVAPDETLLEIETDKANVEIPAETGGVLHILRREGETVTVGEVVARIDTAAAAATETPRSTPGAPEPARMPPTPGGPPLDETARRPSWRPVALERPLPGTERTTEHRRPPAPLSPTVRRLVAEHDLDPAAIPGTGRGGRITAEDVRSHLARAPGPAPAPGGRTTQAPAAAPAVGPPGQPAAAGDDEERVPMGRIRKRIAERLVLAQRTAAILTTFNEIDMTSVLALRARHRQRFKEAHGVDLGLLSFFAVAVIAALREFPAINAEIRGDDIVYKRHVHLGIAVGTPEGLVVPVVHHADRMSFAEIEREIERLAGRAREGRLTLEDLAGGTFTISNGGVYGSLLSTPILNPPQSGILGMHKIEKRPVVVDDQIVVRPMMYVALSYDHRIVDGEQAVTFLVRIKTRLEEPTRLLLNL
jgi:2-oxoglutarate dehydrogenase E2 component (dihydrolipoamide succinyltransferase)